MATFVNCPVMWKIGHIQESLDVAKEIVKNLVLKGTLVKENVMNGVIRVNI